MAHPIHSPSYIVLAELLTERRKELGLLQAEVAVMLNKPQSFVSKYESAGRRLDFIELIDVLRALKTDPHGFLDQLTSQLDARQVTTNFMR
ncbi:helix-turn-helix domain-containing protein [Collimonas sp. NPDC087041]|uniref:helix-turn-helix domain-containing protein n=1 Tax=Collimonas sp. NPDC087041 TaxID=3363960 RepID=UPI0038293660